MKSFTSYRYLAAVGALVVSVTTVSATADCLLTDLDGNGETGFSDLTSLLSAWGPCLPPCLEDIDRNGEVGFSDLTALLAAWGPCAFVYPDYNDALANQIGLQTLLDASGPLTLPQDMYDRVARDLDLIRQARPELIDAPQDGPWTAYRMLVLLEPSASPQAIQQTLDRYQGEILGQSPSVLVLDFPRGINIPALVAVFSELDWVAVAEPDFIWGTYLDPAPGWTLEQLTEGWFEWKVVAPWANGGICNDALTRCECATSYVFFTSADGTLIVSSVASTPYDGGDCTGHPAAP